MMMANIERYSSIRKESLSEEFYFQSFLQEAFEQEVLSDIELDSIKLQCMKLLANSTERYTKGKSSSIKTEVAQTIMQSNFYTIGLYLKSLHDTAIALDMVKTVPLSEIYQKGRKLLNTKLNIAKQLYQFVEKTKISSPNYTYNATLEDGVKFFFRKYDADFEAHETPASIDYQLFNSVDGLVGVEFMIQYLQNLYIENIFCSKFDANRVHGVLCGFDKEYKDLLVNIFGQVLLNALGCIVLKKDVFSLKLGQEELNELKNCFTNSSIESILTTLQHLADELYKALAITSTSSKSYILSGLPEVAARIRAAIESDTLNIIFVPRRSHKTSKVIKYSMGIKMEDGLYRKIVDEIRACRYSNDKIQIIKEQIKALADLEEIIMDSELSETEAMELFKMLDETEIAVLVKRHPYTDKIDEVDYTEAEIKLQRYMKKYMHSLPVNRQKHIKNIISNIEYI
jgi:hypothetical protein